MADRHPTAKLARLKKADYVNALRSVKLHKRDRELLITNYHAPRRTITAKQMARALGFTHFGAANLNYGGLAKRLGNQLGIELKEDEPLWVLITMDWPEGECEWTLRPQVAAALEALGWVAGFATNFPEEIEGKLTEGSSYRVSVNVYERNPVARQRCVEHYGASCVICGFDFGRTYGHLFDGFIHVHHIRQLSKLGTEYIVNPLADLRPVCPNCHAVLHGRNPPYSVDEVRAFLGK